MLQIGGKGSLESTWPRSEARAHWVGMNLRFCALSRPEITQSPQSMPTPSAQVQSHNDAKPESGDPSNHIFPCRTHEKSWPQRGVFIITRLHSMPGRPLCPSPGILAIDHFSESKTRPTKCSGPQPFWYQRLMLLGESNA